MSGNPWASAIILSTVLALALRTIVFVRSPLRHKAWMAALWVLIIAVLVAVFQRFSPHTLQL